MPLDQMDSLVENHPVLEKKIFARDKQSVRTTFKLSQEAMDAKAWLAKHWGITQKEASDSICNALPDLLERLKLPEGRIANMTGTGDPVRKTHVISRGSRRILEDMAKEHGVSRDEMFDFSLWFFKAIEEKQKEISRENRIKALEILEDLMSHAARVDSELSKLLELDDPIHQRYAFVKYPLEGLCGAISSYLDDGTPIDPDDWAG